MAEAKKMNFNPELSEDKQTIRVLNAANNKEQMRVERQVDKTLKLSSQPPTTPAELIQLFLVKGSKTCNLKNAESAEVAAEIYQALDKKGIKVTLSENVLQKLRSHPDHARIADDYLSPMTIYRRTLARLNQTLAPLDPPAALK